LVWKNKRFLGEKCEKKEGFTMGRVKYIGGREATHRVCYTQNPRPMIKRGSLSPRDRGKPPWGGRP